MTLAVKDDLVRDQAVLARPRRRLHRLFETSVEEGFRGATLLAHEMVVTRARGILDLVPQDALAVVERPHHAQLAQRRQGTVDTGRGGSPTLTGETPDELRGRQAPALAGKYVDDLLARAAGAQTRDTQPSVRLSRPLLAHLKAR